LSKHPYHKVLVVLSFFAIYVIWGSTYLFVAFAVDEIPPFIMAGSRFLLASMAMFIIIFFFIDYSGINKRQLINAVIAGILFLGVGNGAMSYALQFIDTGYACLLTSGQPLVLLLMLWVLDKKPLALKSWLGVLLGIAGMWLLVGQTELLNTYEQWLGTIIIFGCLISWGLGSIFVNRSELPKNYFINTAIQIFIGSIFLIVLSYMFNEPTVQWESLSSLAWFSLIYLTIFGSIIAFTAFNFLLKHVSPEKVATSTYVNPVIALILGYLFHNETISLQTVIAAIVLFTGVYFINSAKSKSKHA